MQEHGRRRLRRFGVVFSRGALALWLLPFAVALMIMAPVVVTSRSRLPLVVAVSVLGAAAVLDLVVGALIVRRSDRRVHELRVAVEELREAAAVPQGAPGDVTADEIAWMHGTVTHAVQVIEEHAALLQLAMGAGKVVLWAFDPESGELDYDIGSAIRRGPEEHFGIRSAAERSSLDDRLAGLPAEDAGRVRAAIARALETDEPYEVEYRIPQPDGGMRWMIARGQRQDETGGKARVVGASFDVTATREAELLALQMSRAKTEFLSRVSHELRTPLNAIMGYAQLLALDELSAEQRTDVEQVVSGGRHLEQLIDELLDISRAETGRLALSLEAIPVAYVLTGAATDVAPQAHALQLTMEVAGAEGLHVRADMRRLRQVLVNLLSNAVKFNRAGGTVHVAVEAVAGLGGAGPDDAYRGGAGPDDSYQGGAGAEGAGVTSGRVRIEVTDSGVGIPAELYPRVFVPFDRLGADGKGIPGAGIGLALSKELVETMGGVIGFRSEPGAGSTFWVELDAACAPALGESIGEPSRAESGAFPQAAPVGSAVGTVTGPARAWTVLCIEDNPANLRLTESIFRRLPGCTFVGAVNAGEGLAAAEAHAPDIVLLDLHLPDMEGEEVLGMLRRSAGTRAVPVIVLSADATRERRRRLLELGAAAYVTKPVEIAELVGVVTERLGITGDGAV